MIKIKKLCSFLLAAIILGMSACAVDADKPNSGENLSASTESVSSASEEEIPYAEELDLNYREITLCEGESVELEPTVPEGTIYDTITFESKDTFVAKTEENKIVAVKAGKTEVRAVLNNGVEAICQVEVLKEPEVMSLSRKNLILFSDEEFELTLQTDVLGLEPVSLSFGDNVSASMGEPVEGENGELLLSLKIQGIAEGESVIKLETYNGMVAECAVKTVPRSDYYYLNGFECYDQWPELPTGCEVTATTMAMRYLGFDLGKCELADNYLPYSWDFFADVRYTFLGHPRDPDSAGCYAPCIVTTVENYFAAKGYEEDWMVTNLTGSSPQVLYDYVAKGIPVAVWVTSSMREPYVNYWCYGEDGEMVPWMFPEHCVTLIGYDKEEGTVDIADSEYGFIRTVYLSTFEHIYEMMMQQAIVVEKK